MRSMATGPPGVASSFTRSVAGSSDSVGSAARRAGADVARGAEASTCGANISILACRTAAAAGFTDTRSACVRRAGVRRALARPPGCAARAGITMRHGTRTSISVPAARPAASTVW